MLPSNLDFLIKSVEEMKVSHIAQAHILNSRIDLELLCLADAQLDESWQGENYALPFNRLYLVEEGSGILDTGAGEVLMKPGMGYLVPAGAALRFLCSGYMKKVYIHFSLLGPDRYDLMEGFSLVGAVQLPPDVTQRLRYYGARDSVEDSLRVRQIFYEVLSLFLPQYDLWDRKTVKYSEHVLSTISYIRENLSVSLRVEELAKRLYISRSGLSELFRREVGVSIGKYIDDQVMTAALLRLRNTDDSIHRISRDLGFTDQGYFSRRFRQLYGMTPTALRRKNRV